MSRLVVAVTLMVVVLTGLASAKVGNSCKTDRECNSDHVLPYVHQVCADNICMKSSNPLEACVHDAQCGISEINFYGLGCISGTCQCKNGNKFDGRSFNPCQG